MVKTITELIKEKRILVAAHRGAAGGNIPPNTIAAFDIALQEGADILEMDLFKSKDGEIFVFHTGTEPAYLEHHFRIETLTSEEIRRLRLCNVDLAETFMPLNTFDEVLEHYKNKCILNLDRCINIVKDVMETVERHGMSDQILLKSDPSDASLKLVETYASTVNYMPVYMEKDTASEKIEKMNINYVGAELVFESENSAIAQDSYLEMMHRKGKFLWANSLVYSSRVKLSAGHNDDISVTGHPDKGWGWLADKGFDIIQTDWTHHCVSYLKSRL